MSFAMDVELIHGLRHHVWTREMTKALLLEVEELGSGWLDDSVG